MNRVGALLLLASVLVLPTGTIAVHPASAHVRPNNRWTPRQAGTVRVIRGTPLYVVRCKGLGPRRAAYRHFACSGQTARDEKSIHTALFTYVLHPLGKYVGRRSAYIATNLRVTAFSVP